MNKFKVTAFALAAVAITVGSVLAVQASTSPLAVTCAGSVSGNVVTWTASPTGGNTPYSVLWSGDSSVAGSTSTAMGITYGTNGTYTAMIQATDASSTMATSTCAATVTANVVVTPTSTLNVFVAVNNTAGGLAIPSSFTGMVSGAGAVPASFTGNAAGTAVVVNAGATYAVSASSIGNYVANTSGNCFGPITAGASASCTVTETFVQPTATSTPVVVPPTLTIAPSGDFLARGMIVTSVGSGSFQGTIWGISYTVNWTGSLNPEFLFRKGDKATSTTNPADQLNVGDVVGVSGRVSPSSPLVVNAAIVRDYSITVARPGLRRGQPDSPFYNGVGNGGGNGKGNGKGDDQGDNVSSSANTQSQLNNLLNQLHNLQDLFKGKH